MRVYEVNDREELQGTVHLERKENRWRIVGVKTSAKEVATESEADE